MGADEALSAQASVLPGTQVRGGGVSVWAAPPPRQNARPKRRFSSLPRLPLGRPLWRQDRVSQIPCSFPASDGNWPALKQSISPAVRATQTAGVGRPDSSAEGPLQQGTVSSQPVPLSALGAPEKLVGRCRDPWDTRPIHVPVCARLHRGEGGKAEHPLCAQARLGGRRAWALSPGSTPA